MAKFNPKDFTVPAAKPLPVVLLLDVSTSMQGDKIASLNTAVQDMLDALATEEKMETEILVSIITFGHEVLLHTPYTKPSQVQWVDMQAYGNTPMGTALKMAKAMIEDKETTPSRAYRPTVVLVSDGEPDLGWEKPLQDFIENGRSAKCDRMAMSIGNEGKEPLKLFIAGTEHGLFYAEDASQIPQFFKRLTMSVSTRSHSKNPNIIPSKQNIASLSDGEMLF